ncbi:MAG: thioredoxin-disulfide reductase [Planctomycetes bacterium]|nr:thioredoxin-disulfide reductase [Planctomycetota bacterium]
MRDVIIIGSGPAGLAAGLYTARANLEPLLVEGAPPEVPGGQLMLTTDVENFPGFPEGIQGPELMERMRQQAERFGLEIRPATVSEVTFAPGAHGVAADGRTWEARALILATGARARLLGLDSERRLLGRGVSTCATCDGAFYRGKHVVLVGGGDSAMEEAGFLTRFAAQVTVVHRRAELRASKIMQDRARANPKIAFVWDTVITDLRGEDRLSAVAWRNVKSGAEGEIACDGLFIAIGHDPQTTLFRGQLALDPEGYLIVEGDSTRTSVAGVFAAGDVVDRTYRQAITAAGMGCKAAIDAERYLESL